MHKLSLLFLAAGIAALSSCTNAPKADKAEATDAKAAATATGATYKVDVAQSAVNFVGAAPTHQHNGTFMIKDGNIMADNNTITGGKLTIDVASMKIVDKDTSGSAKLTGHLSSPDFFDVAKNPTAMFEITGVKAGVDTAAFKDLVMKDATHTVTGNLTLKGTSKSITFPAKIAMAGNGITTDANFNIDRTQWGMSYGNDNSLGDKMIRPLVNIQLHIVASK